MCFLRKKQQIINFSQELLTKSNADDNEALFIRCSNIVKDPNAILIVPQTHTALVVKGGGDARYYKSGNYPIFENKSELKMWKRGIPVEVIYFPKDKAVKLGWGTYNKILFRDKYSDKTMNVGASGDCRLTVVNPEQFYKRSVGFKTEYSIDDFQDEFRSIIVDRFVSNFLSVVEELSLMYDQFDANRARISTAMQNKLNSEFSSYWGVSLEWFTIGCFMIDEDDVAAIEQFSAEAIRRRQMQEYLRELERLEDKQWERDNYLRRLEIEDRNAYYELLKIIGKPSVAIKFPNRNQESILKCPHCKESNTGTAIFCSKCGRKLQ